MLLYFELNTEPQPEIFLRRQLKLVDLVRFFFTILMAADEVDHDAQCLHCKIKEETVC